MSRIGNVSQTGQVTSEQDLSRLVTDALHTMASSDARCDIQVVARYDIPGEFVNGQYLENPNVMSRFAVYMLDYTRLLTTNARDAAAADAQREKDRKAQPTGGAAPKL